MCVVLSMLGAFTVVGCSSSSDKPVDAALKPFVDVDFELKTVTIPKVLEEGKYQMAQYLTYVGAIVREQRRSPI